ncbi:STAS domain-containing protein [Terasakiella sp. A23]|uniref:STAS domain-containing protein n=1 Tax=Terasakiella sp. FCG-A23 TaxID=3080561 RepID=UPI002953C5C2|nr:STAS domain-containing protein [Terasakiella sp. A23]MDV7338689.1 STAS domain-containing protein [Terasakiella sp. A23]
MSEAFEIKVENDQVVLKLQPILDMAVADDFLESLKSCLSKHKNLTLDSSDVERVSTPCIQVLLAAGFKVEKAGGRFSIENVTSVFERGMTELGVSDCLNNWRKN